MKTLVFFLRGINVGGINIKMNDLKTAMESMGYIHVKTILATGNIIVSADEGIPDADHKLRIENGLSLYFGYEANVIMKSVDDIHGMLEESKGDVIPEGYHHYVLLTNDETIGKRLKTRFETCSKAEKEKLILGEYGVYWIVPKGDTLKSDFGRLCLGKKEYKTLLTSRNMNTIYKISESI